MTDLVERLRRFADNTRWHEQDQLSPEAASTIEALSERIGMLTEALIDWRNSWLCPATDFEASVERLLKNTEASLTPDLSQ